VFFLVSSTLDNREMCHHQKISLLLQRYDELGSRFPEAEVRRRLANRGLGGATTEAALGAVPWAEKSVLDEIGVVCGLDFQAYALRERPYLSSDQVRALLGRGMAIGAHSIDHPRYADIPIAEQLRQTRESARFLQQRFACVPRAFAFPHTDSGVSQEFFAALAQAGEIDASFGTSAPSEDRGLRNFQRFSMEKPCLPAPAILARQALRRIGLRCTGRTVIRRSSLGRSLSN
jgi:hypothetical protein